MTLFDALQLKTEKFVEAISAWFVVAIPNLIAAILILIVGLMLAGWAGRTARRWIEHDNRIDPTLGTVLGSLARYGITLVVLVAVLGQLGFQTTSLIAALGAAGLAIGLALQNTLSNIAAGFMLLWLRPFRQGDYIESPAATGTVKEVGLFATELRTWDGIYKFVPNAELWNKQITNYSRYDTRLVDLSFGIAYDDDVAKAREVLLGMAQEDPRTLDTPAAPITFVDNLGDSAVVVALRLWVPNTDYWNVKRDLTEEGKTRLESAGMSIPFPQIDVHYPDQQHKKPAAPQSSAGQAADEAAAPHKGVSGLITDIKT